MKELLTTLLKWESEKKPYAVATVVKTWGSSPRPVGSNMLIAEDMEMAGSVSGGCVENALITEALPLIQKGEGKNLAFGVTHEDAWSVGLSCGGRVEVFVERSPAFDDRSSEIVVWEQMKSSLQNNEHGVLVTALQDGDAHHVWIAGNGTVVGEADELLIREGIRASQERKSQVVEWEGKPYFAQVFPRKSQLLVIGAAHISADLIRLAKLYDFEVTLIDPRGVFTQKTQFAVSPDQLITKYPSDVLSDFILDQYTYAVVLSHDPKIDDDALHVLLRSNVGYIGALGSRKTHEKRVNRLKKAGFSEEEISRIHAPVGVDIKAKWPNEIALSIMGEMIKVKNAYL